MPGKRFRLPSRGRFYTNGELVDGVVDGEIEVFSMSAVDEIALRSPEFLYSGEAITRVIRRCIPEVLQPLELLSKDVDFLLACLRVVSYGGVYQISAKCELCEEKQKTKNNITLDEFMKEVALKADAQGVDFDLAMSDSRVQKKIKTITSKSSAKHTHSIDLAGILQNNTVEISDGEYNKHNITLTNSQVVSIMPYRMSSAVTSLQFQNDDKSLNLDNIEEFVSFLLSVRILSIDGIVDHALISEWVTALPRVYKKEIDDAIDIILDWGTDFTYTVVCPESNCDHTTDVTTLLNPITFFMTPSE